jgi:hypothetical protein
METRFRASRNQPKEAGYRLYMPDGSLYDPSNNSSTCVREESAKQRVTVTGAFPMRHDGSGALVETIRDPENPERLMFLRWENEKVGLVRSIERDEKVFVPPDPTSRSFPELSLPSGILRCGEPAELLAEIMSTISTFVRLRDEQLLILATFVLTSWFPDCLEVAPYIWIVGPLGSAKTNLSKLLRCLCRRGLIAGDLRAGSVYKLTDSWDPTLIIDELESPSAELLRILRTGSVPGVPTYRNGQRFSAYGLKAIATRQPLGDSALLSRGLIVSILPTEDDLLPLDEATMQKIGDEYQAKLLTYRLTNHAAVKHFLMPSGTLQGLSPRMKQIARALAAPLLGDPQGTSDLLAILRGCDAEARNERWLEPEWLVASALFEVSHEGMERGQLVSDILVGGIAYHVNKKLQNQGEDIRLGARKVGDVLKSLGVRTERLSRLGRGLTLTLAVKRKIHEVARQLSIDRRSITSRAALEQGYGGARCSLCDEFGLTGGLRFDDPDKARR